MYFSSSHLHGSTSCTGLSGQNMESPVRLLRPLAALCFGSADLCLQVGVNFFKLYKQNYEG